MASYYLLLFLFLVPLLLFLRSKSFYIKSNYKLPPGPWTIPFIGSLHHLIGAGLPHHAYRNLSEQYGDLIFLQLGEHPTVVVSSSQAAREILKTHDLGFSSRPFDTTVKILSYGGKGIGFAPYGEHWRKVRKICISELLSPKQVQSFRSIREDEVRSFIGQITSLSSSGESFNLTQGLLAVTNNLLLRAIMGSKVKVQNSVLADILKAFDVAAGSNLSNLFPSSQIARKFCCAVNKAEKCHQSFDRLLDNFIRDHKEKSIDGHDMLAVLLRLQDEVFENSSLSIDIIKAVIFDVIIGGTDTTATTLDWLMAELMKNPTVMKKAQTEVRQQLGGCGNIIESDLSKLNFMHLIIKETLRLHPVFPLNVRRCRGTCKISDYDIPAGTNVLVNTWAIGRNSKYGYDADTFRPERFEDSNINIQFNGMDFDLIPFGSGRRICPGMSFAIATIAMVLANLLYHFDWELPCGMRPDQVDMTEVFGSTSRRKSPLLVHAQPYHSCS